MKPEAITIVKGPNARALPWRVAKARAADRPFRAPHHTVSEKGLYCELALSAGGVFYLDEPAEWPRRQINNLANARMKMDPRCRPVVILVDRVYPRKETDACIRERLEDLFSDWAAKDHVIFLG